MLVALGGSRDQAVLVGGAVSCLLVTDPAVGIGPAMERRRLPLL